MDGFSWIGVLLIVYYVRSFFILDLLLIWDSFNYDCVEGLIRPRNLRGFFSFLSSYTVLLLRLLSVLLAFLSRLPAFLRSQSTSPAASTISKSNMSSTYSSCWIFPSSHFFLAFVLTQNRLISIALTTKVLGSSGCSYRRRYARHIEKSDSRRRSRIETIMLTHMISRLMKGSNSFGGNGWQTLPGSLSLSFDLSYACIVCCVYTPPSK